MTATGRRLIADVCSTCVCVRNRQVCMEIIRFAQMRCDVKGKLAAMRYVRSTPSETFSAQVPKIHRIQQQQI